MAEQHGTELPFVLAPSAGNKPSGSVICLDGVDSQKAMGIEYGFLKGRLGRIRSGENELYMAAPVNATDIGVITIQSCIIYRTTSAKKLRSQLTRKLIKLTLDNIAHEDKFVCYLASLLNLADKNNDQ